MGVRGFPVSHRAFPLSTVCPGGSAGEGQEIVPPWLNPVVIALLVISAAVAVAATAAT
ncbi:hypothetical protein [Streptomyces sp. NPDC005336]|uniref:hypothetical protein n=1 Tax=Streptomyces sp. NPDC005336 TaxID=3157035 RepID=UPI0033BEE4AE